MAHLGRRRDCKAHPCDDSCYNHWESGGRGDETPAWARERKYAKCKQFFEAGDDWCGGGRRMEEWCRMDHTCAGGRAGESERHLKECFACVDDGNIWNFDIGGRSTERRATTTCTLSPENAEKKRKAEEKERECDRQATEKRNQCLTQPAPGSSLRIDGAQLGGMGPKPD